MGYHDFKSQGLRMDTASGTGFVVETGFFCAYTCLFLAALPVLTSARRLKDGRSAKSAWVFLIFCILMYLVATVHLIFEGFRFYKSTFLTFKPDERILYLQNPNNWEFLGLVTLVFIQTWLGDALVIYRCYFIWDNNLWLIFVPVCLLLGTIGINIYVMDWIAHSVFNGVSAGLTVSVYPLAFAQNFMTTSLIVVKILLQHRESKKAGVVDVGSKLSLVHIVRIIIESAAIYTIQLLLLNVLHFRNDNFQYVVQPAIVPSIGVTFVLLALRIEASRNESPTMKNDLGIRSSIIPQWLCEPNRETGPENGQNGTSLPAEDPIPVTEHKVAVQEKSDVESCHWDSEFSTSSSERRDKVASNSLLSSDNGGCASASNVPVHV